MSSLRGAVLAVPPWCSDPRKKPLAKLDHEFRSVDAALPTQIYKFVLEVL
jgi:hypothetical protein